MQPFQVYLRIRPSEGETLIEDVDDKKVVICKDQKRKSFNFDRIFSSNQTNDQIFDQSLRENIDHFIEGYNTSILAYGITGSGKSHTIFGCPTDDGLAIRILNYLITRVKGRVDLNFYEVYNESIRDLLAQHQKPLTVLQDAKGAYIAGIQTVQVASLEDVRNTISKGNLQRSLASTMYNVQSSRSHAIIQVSLNYTANNQQITPKLFIVDLAGSEKVYQEQNLKNQQEGSNINRSLLALSHCLTMLSDKSKKHQHIPYRNSKLTRLLQDSLGGNTRTIMIACIQQHKSCFDEVINTLTYSSRATQIKRNLCKSVTNLQTIPAEVKEIDSKQVYLTKIYNDIYNNIEEYYEISQSILDLQALIQTNKQQLESIYQNSLQHDQETLNNNKLYHLLLKQQKENNDIEVQLQHSLKINLHQKQLQKSLLLQINEEQQQNVQYYKDRYNECQKQIQSLTQDNIKLHEELKAKEATIKVLYDTSKNPSFYDTNDSDLSYPSSGNSSTSNSQIKKKNLFSHSQSSLLDFLEKPRFTRHKSPPRRFSPFRSPLTCKPKRYNDTHTTTINLFAFENKENM